MKEQEHIEDMTMYELKLYVVGRTPKSIDVIEDLVRLLEDALDDHYHLDVIDIIESSVLAEKAKILATPSLEKVSPGPARKIIGDLSDKERVLLTLGLTAQHEEVTK